MRCFSGCNFYYSVIYEKIMVCSGKEKCFLQSEKVDPELHLYILLPFSILSATSLSEQCWHIQNNLIYFECLLLLSCLQDYRTFTTTVTEHSFEVFLFAICFVREKDCYFSSLEGTCREILDVTEQFCGRIKNFLT